MIKIEEKLKINPDSLIKHENIEYNFKDLVNHLLTPFEKTK